MRTRNRRGVAVGLLCIAAVCALIAWSQWTSASEEAEFDSKVAEMEARLKAAVDDGDIEESTVHANRTGPTVLVGVAAFAGLSGVVLLATAPTPSRGEPQSVVPRK